MTGVKLEEWRNLLNICANVTIGEGEDKLIWLLSASRKFSVKSFYAAMQTMESVPYNFWWKVKIPLRIKFSTELISRHLLVSVSVRMHACTNKQADVISH